MFGKHYTFLTRCNLVCIFLLTLSSYISSNLWDVHRIYFQVLKILSTNFQNCETSLQKQTQWCVGTQEYPSRPVTPGPQKPSARRPPPSPPPAPGTSGAPVWESNAPPAHPSPRVSAQAPRPRAMLTHSLGGGGDSSSLPSPARRDQGALRAELVGVEGWRAWRAVGRSVWRAL